MSWIARRRIAVGMLSLCAFAGFAPCALAQETRATVTGTVRDAQGSVVPGATVTVLNTDTNVSSEVDEQRGWPLHGPARPTRTRQGHRGAPGFKTFVREGITLRTAETVTIDVQLSVGGSRKPSPSAPASSIESNESTIAQTIENKRISELPLNGRQVYMLMQLTAGTLLHADDLRRDRLLRHAGMGCERFALGPRQPHRQQRVPDRRCPELGTGGGTGQLELRPAGRRDRGVQDLDLERRRLVRPHQRRRRQHDAAIGHEPPARIRDRPASRDLARFEPDPEHPQQHLEQGTQVLQRRRRRSAGRSAGTRRSSWAATRASTRTSRSR